MYNSIPEIMTFKECQQLLKVGKNTMLDLLHTRQIDGFMIGNRWKITRESVIEFIIHRQESPWKIITIFHGLLPVENQANITIVLTT